jgi:transcriptional regulator with XRE-family HTH domain
MNQMRGTSSEQPAEDGTRLAALLAHLFETRLSPSGRPYSLTEVSAGTSGKLTVSYLSALRKGKVAAPSADKVQALANFFGVRATYFTGQDSLAESTVSGDDDDDELRQAMAQPLVRLVARRAGSLGHAEQALILRLMDDAHALAMGMSAKIAQANTTPMDGGERRTGERRSEDRRPED